MTVVGPIGFGPCEQSVYLEKNEVILVIVVASILCASGYPKCYLLVHVHICSGIHQCHVLIRILLCSIVFYDLGPLKRHNRNDSRHL